MEENIVIGQLTRRFRPAILGGMIVSAAFVLLTVDSARAISHTPLDSILRKCVKGGRVDYAGIKKKAADRLDAYVEAVGKAALPSTSSARLAFYLNAYNALVIKAVVDRWPAIKSVMKVPGFFKRIKYRVAGKTVTLDQLENKIIRPEFKDARVHFALVCGARSCPPLSSRAFSSSNVQSKLERLTKRFINSRLGVKKSKSGEYKVSQLFNWYADDFKRAAGSVGKFLAKYHTKDGAALATQTTFAFQRYSWALNSK